MILKVWLNQIFQTLTQCYGSLNTGQVRLRCIFHKPFLINDRFTLRKKGLFRFPDDIQSMAKPNLFKIYREVLDQ